MQKSRLWWIVALLSCSVGLVVLWITRQMDSVGASILIAAVCGVGGAIMFPDWGLAGAVSSLAISPVYVMGPGSTLYGVGWATAHNLFIVVMIMPLLLRARSTNKANPVLVSQIAHVFLTFTLSDRFPSLTAFQTFRSCASASVGPVMYCLRIGQAAGRKVLILIGLLAPFNVLLGLGMQMVGTRDAYTHDPSGAFRLQGASIPPHLAMLGVIGIIVTLWLGRGARIYLALTVVDVAIVTMTGTRGAVGVGIMAVLCVVMANVAQRGRPRVSDCIAAFVVAIATFYVLGWGLPNLLIRNIGGVESGFNTSGRLLGWNYFWNVAMASPFFGRGLGASSIASEGVLSGFSVPHNEYLRFFVDGGIVGLIIMLAGYAFAFQSVIREEGGPSAAILILVTACVAVYAFVDNTLSTAQFTVPLWLFLGIVNEDSRRRAIEVADEGHRSV